jgi:C1A family cysteine protease
MAFDGGRGLGHIPDAAKAPDELRDWTLDEPISLRARFAASPPPAADLGELVVDVLDQGKLGSCVANATAQALRMRHVAQGVARPILASRLMVYFLARSIDHTTGEDAGTQVRSAFRAIEKLGFAPEEVWPYDDGPSRFKLFPSSAAFKAAHDQKSPTSYHRITSTGHEKLVDIKRAIAAGYPVVFGTEVDAEFCDGSFYSKKVLLPPKSGASVGGHSMLFTGYSGDTLKVLNSWSKAYGDHGYVYFSPEYTNACTDCWVVEHTPVEGER